MSCVHFFTFLKLLLGHLGPSLGPLWFLSGILFGPPLDIWDPKHGSQKSLERIILRLFMSAA